MRPWVAISTLVLLLFSMLPATPAAVPAVAAATPVPKQSVAGGPPAAEPAQAAMAAFTPVAPLPATAAAPVYPATGTAARAGRVYTNGSRRRLQVALTFDAGADRGFPDRYLQILTDKKAKATFFLTGNWAKANRSDLATIAASGHPIANHSVSHPDFVTVSEAEQRRQILETEALLAKAAPETYVMHFRPPYGSYNAQVNRVLGELGYTNIMWDVDTLDWMHKGSDFVADRFRRLTRPGSIILMHMAAPDTVAVLPELIDWLQEQGLEPVTLPELLRDDAVAAVP